MKLVAQVKLQPTPEQQAALRATLEQANAACNAISATVWEAKTYRQFELHRLTYHDIKDAFGLSAQVVVRCIAKVVDAYKLDRNTQRAFKPRGAIAYDSRILSWNLDKLTVSIWTVAGRQRISFTAGEWALELLSAQRGESDLCYVDGAFHLLATCDVETPDPIAGEGFLGVDLGIKTIAADSDGERYSGSHLNNLRKRHFKLRQKWQAKGTKSARRLLKKRRRKERRMQKDVNHTIARRLVDKANAPRAVSLLRT
jgi:putative transposase